MRLSISARVSIACVTVMVLALTLLAIGLTVGNKIHGADTRITRLSEALQMEDRLDQAQRRLRQDVGSATRKAEHGGPVPDAQWAKLVRQTAEFNALSATAGSTPIPASDSALKSTHQTRQATTDFAAMSAALIEVARSRPSEIKATMPHFVAALKNLEARRSRAREILAHDIWIAADENGRESRRDVIAVLLGGLGIVAIIFGMTVWLRRRVLLPITTIAARLREFKIDGGDSEVPGLSRADELGDLARGVFEYRSAVENRRAAERRAEFLAHHDMLTGLANRLLFENRLAHELSRAARTGDVVAVFAIDLDGFKAINDRLGHAGGDRALKRTAELLSRCVRSDDLLARIGGDEFAIIQVARDQPAAAETLLSRIFKTVSEPSEDEVAVRMSIGVALSEPDQTGEDLHELADVALYRAKAEGRNTARFFNKHLKEEESLRLRLARDLEQAVSADELHLAFQPIADTASMKIVGYEALLRWRHPSLGEVSPELFIPIAESSGLIKPIGLWVIDQALSVASTWDTGLSLAINLSPLQLRSTGLPSDICEAAQRWGISLGRLELEVTESATLLGYHRDSVLRTLRALQDVGAKVVMDDFGTGHSSLGNLKDFTFDKLKIDRSFVAAMLTHPPSASIVKATIGLGKSLGLTIVAEGVETEAQLADLRRWGCDQVQGYLIGRPARHAIDGGRARAARTP
jgi:diguanylate cyclase (GGDEF)-like protein